MKKIYFARHGQSVLNVSGHFAGHTDTPLTDEGRRQASKAGKKARELSIDTIVASPLSRAHDTAKLIAIEIDYPEDKIILNPKLMERYYGTAEASPYSTQSGHLEENHEDFETEDELQNRVDEILKWIDSLPGETILVVSHGGIGRRLRQQLMPESEFFDRIPNAQIERWR